jgi:Na+/H+-dicarboxylate symporter
MIVAAVVAGFLCGLFATELAHAVELDARLYLALLSMCILPIMVGAFVWGIGQMLRDRPALRAARLDLRRRAGHSLRGGVDRSVRAPTR